MLVAPPALPRPPARLPHLLLPVCCRQRSLGHKVCVRVPAVLQQLVGQEAGQHFVIQGLGGNLQQRTAQEGAASRVMGLG